MAMVFSNIGIIKIKKNTVKTMSGIVISIDPVAFNVGDLEIRLYFLAIMLAIAVGILITVRQANKKGIAPREILLRLIFSSGFKCIANTAKTSHFLYLYL